MTVTIVNERDALLNAATTRDGDPRAGKYLKLSGTNIFRVTTGGQPSPTSITITGLPVNITGGGSVTFSVSGGATITTSGNTATLTFANMPVDQVTVTGSITDLGQTYTDTLVISKVQDGVVGTKGDPGTPGNTVAQSFLYKWSTVDPALPAGTATLTWASGKNTSYIGQDAWFIDPPANPGTPGIKLYMATKSVTAPYGTQTTDVTFSAGAVVTAYTQNGLAGPPGIKNTPVRAYKWGTGPAPTITGTSVYTWATSALDTVPTGWSVTKPDAPALGYTLYEATVGIIDSTGATTSSVNWGSAAVVGISYMPTNGTGTPGATGNSAMIYYTLVDGFSLAASPDHVDKTGGFPPSVGDWGSTRAWTAQPSVPAANQSVFQSNGILNSVSGVITWGLPYMSAFRVANLSAFNVNTGGLIVSDYIKSANGNFMVDSNGLATFRSIAIIATDGTVILAAGENAIRLAAIPTGAKNSDIIVGGRNLYPDSGFERKTHPCIERNATAGVDATAQAGTAGVSPYAGTNFLFFQSAATGTGYDMYVYLGGPLCPVTPGKTYKYSFMYATDTNGGITASNCYLRLSNGVHYPVPLPVLATGKAWTLCEYDFVCPAGITTVEARFGLICNGFSFMTVDCVQMEEGNKRTQWTPAPEDISADVAAIAFGGRNLIRTNSLPSSDAGYAMYNAFGVGLGPTFETGRTTYGQYSPTAEGVIYIRASGAIAPSKYASIYMAYQGNTALMPTVVAGKRYEFSAALSVHRATGQVQLNWWDQNGVVISNATAYGNYLTDTYGDYSTGVPRSGGFAIAPAGARYATLEAVMSGANESDPYLFTSQWYIGEASATQAVFSPYSPNPSEAMNALNAIASDGILSPSEKPSVNQDFAVIMAEHQAIYDQGTSLGLIAERDAFYSTVAALASYLGTNALIGWNVIPGGDVVIDGPTFRGKFQTYYTTKQAMLNSIAAKTATLSTWAGTTGAGKPQDNATVGATAGTNLKSSDGVVMSDQQVRNGYTENGVGHVAFPQGGSYSYSNGEATGAIEVALPTWAYNSNTMLKFTVEIFEYLTGRSCTYVIAGYNYSGGYWVNVTVEYTGPVAGRKRVRFGTQGGVRNSVYIGEIDSKWQYPKIRVTEVTAAHSYYDWSTWASGWAVNIYNTVGQIQDGVTVAEPGIGGLLGRVDGLTAANVPSFIAPNAITDTQIGGNLKSANWNGATDGTGVGWLLERDTGNLYGGNVKLRGSVMSGAYNGWGWPTSGTGYYLGPEGLLIGNGNTGKYFEVTKDGNVYAPNFYIENGSAVFGGTLAGPSGTFGTITAGTIQSGSSGQRTVTTEQGVKVYDTAGTLRVVLGNLA